MTTSARWTRLDVIFAAAIALLTFTVFRLSPVRQLGDSGYSMLVSESLIHHRTFALDAYVPNPVPDKAHSHALAGPYQLELFDGHVYYHFPPGTSVLSVPYVATMNLFGVSAARGGRYDGEGEARLELGLAAALMAAFSVLAYRLARLRLPRPWALGVALVTAFGTQVWSTASRGMWSDTWCLVLVGSVVLVLVRHELDGAPLRPVLLATLLAWSFFVRPTAALTVVAATLYVARVSRRHLPALLSTGAAWAALFVAYSRHHFHTNLPAYYSSSSFSRERYWEALAGNLVSPGRGLLVYVPVVAVVVVVAVRARARLASRRLCLMALAVSLVHLLLIAGFIHWWGGYSYGPRFTTGLIPWVLVVAVLAIEAMLAAPDAAPASTAGTRLRRPLTWPLVVGALTIVWGITLHAAGAVSRATWRWNDGIDQEEGKRVWSWRRAQFLAPVIPPPPRAVVALPLETRVLLGDPASARFLGDGWGTAEMQFRWTEGHAAKLVVSLPPEDVLGEQLELRMKLSPYVVDQRLPVQRLEVRLDGVTLVTFALRDPAPLVYTVAIPRRSVQPRSELTLVLRDAASPISLGTGNDQRLLGAAVHWLELRSLKED